MAKRWQPGLLKWQEGMRNEEERAKSRWKRQWVGKDGLGLAKGRKLSGEL